MNEDNNSDSKTLTETEIKLRDAAIQFQLAVDHIDDEDYFRACINSFISFARSITMIMEKESSKNAELLSWYKKHTDEFAIDPLMRFFNEQRVLTVHLGNVRPKAQSVPLRSRMPPDDSSVEPTMSIWVFDNVQAYLPNETGNVFRLCEQYLQRLTRLVQEWLYLRAVTEAPRKVIEESSRDAPKRTNSWTAQRTESG